MEKKLLTFSDALTMIAAAIAENGADYVYRRDWFGCRYVEGARTPGGCLLPEGERNLKPGCIVGLGLVKKRHVTLKKLAKMENGVIAGTFRYELEEKAGLQFTRKALAFLFGVQSLQDGQMPWGEALTTTLSSFKDTADAELNDSEPCYSYERDRACREETRAQAQKCKKCGLKHV